MKYLLIRIKERNGEYEYLHEVTRPCRANQDPAVIADRLAATWYDSKSKKLEGSDSSVYGFFGDTIIASVLDIIEIPKEHYDILQLYAV